MTAKNNYIKVGVTGTHHCGKTTIIKDISIELNRQGYTTEVVSEAARACPLPVNEKCFLSTQLWLALSQITKEIEMSFSKKHDNGNIVLLTDRAILDNYAYALSFEIRKRKHFTGTQIIKGLLNYWIRTYSIIFYLKPLPAPPMDDGVRSTDPRWQREIDRIIHSTIQHYRLNDNLVYTIHTTNREERVKQALLHLTPLLKNNGRSKKTGYTTSKLVQEQIPVQEVVL